MIRTLCLTFALIALATAARAEPAPRIHEIRVHTRDIYTPEEAASGWLYGLLNDLHVRTREGTVRKFLLFAEGDTLNPALLAETERNLRALLFIRSADITTEPAGPGQVDIDVTTQDTWTTTPQLAVSRKGGFTTFGAAFVERNLAGTGRELELTYDEQVERIARYVALADPHFIRPRVRLSLYHADNSDGEENRASIQRDFESVTSPFAGLASFDVTTRRRRMYADGEAVREFREEHRARFAEWGVALHRTEGEAIRARLGGWVYRDRFTPEPGRPDDPRPADRDFRYLYTRLDLTRISLRKLDYVDRGPRFQDYNLGTELSLFAGISPTGFGAPKTTGLLSLSARDGLALGESGLLQFSAGVETRVGADRANRIWTGEARLVKRLGSAFPQALVSRLNVVAGQDLDDDMQFFADGYTGLRAYRVYAFSGDRAAVLNLEYRVAGRSEWLRLFVPGAALFVDTGGAAPPGEPIRFSTLKTDLGAGLRLLLPRSSVHTVFRLDFAWAVDRDPMGRRGFLISFANSQAF